MFHILENIYYSIPDPNLIRRCFYGDEFVQYRKIQNNLIFFILYEDGELSYY
jgi:hypothetical protein